MEIKNTVSVGTLESNDTTISIQPSQDGLDISIESIVFKQFGQEIERVVREMCQEFSVQKAKIYVNDRGALECTLRARMEAAFQRARG